MKEYVLQAGFQGSYAAQMRQYLLECLKESQQGVCLDFRQVQRVDAVGLGVLVTLQKYAKTQGCQFMLMGMSEEIYQLFQRARLSSAFSIQRAS